MMSLGWVIAGTVGQMFLGFFLLMLVIFSAAGIANGNDLAPHETGILDFSIFALPSLCAICACIVLYLYHVDAGASSYWWYAVPVVAAALYLIYAIHLNDQLAAGRMQIAEGDMPQVSGNALVLLIQLLDSRIAALERIIQETGSDDEGLADHEDELFRCSRVADELRVAYEDACIHASNLPPYAQLVRESGRAE
jgi:hypothetical protein